jgi:hypothetical protein
VDAGHIAIGAVATGKDHAARQRRLHRGEQVVTVDEQRAAAGCFGRDRPSDAGGQRRAASGAKVGS